MMVEEEYNSPQDEYSDDSESATEDEEEEFCVNSATDQQDVGEELPATRFAYIKIGRTELVVSSNGTIRHADDIFSTSHGINLVGTPYRIYPVEVENNLTENYFVHDIVWRAFNGEPPTGWEVRHTMWEAKNGGEIYSNALVDLEIYMSTVTYIPSVRASLPEPSSY